MKNIRFAVAGILLAAASSSFAIEQSWYGKIGFGITDPDTSGLDNATGFNLTLGYQMNPNIAVEGTYADWGESSDSVTERYGNLETDWYEFTSTAKSSVSGSTMSIGGIISTDVNQPLSGGFKAGLHSWEAEAKWSLREQYTWVVGFDGTGGYITDGYQDSLSGSNSDDGIDLYYGLVGTYRMDQWLVSLDYTVYQTDDADPSVISLSLGMQF